jgi:phosphohistidine phosphatase
MKHQLWLFRHAKSDWDTNTSDRERPLSKRGRKDSIRMGQWMSENRLIPDRIISSPAERAFQTCEFLQQGFQGEINVPVWDERLYLADSDTLLEVMMEQGDNVEKLMIVGHNPGLDDLLRYLCNGDLPLTSKGKLMTTSTLAIIELSDTWTDINSAGNHLVQISRPKEIFD